MTAARTSVLQPMALCVCGHVSALHRKGSGPCGERGCACGEFHERRPAHEDDRLLVAGG